jgi:hypothetical protein
MSTARKLAEALGCTPDEVLMEPEGEEEAAA